MNEKFNRIAADSNAQFTNSLRWIVGVVIAGIGINAAMVGIGVAVVNFAVR